MCNSLRYSDYVKFGLQSIDQGERGTDQTVAELIDLVKESESRPHVRVLAINVLREADVPGMDEPATARALFDWVRGHVRFYSDPLEVETVQAPEVTAFDLRAGDCDDHSALMAALARSVGIEARFVVIGDSPSRFSHIYPEVRIDGRWIAVDTTGGAEFGQKPPDIGVKKIYNFPDSEGNGMAKAAQAIDRAAMARELKKVGWSMLAQGWTQGRIDDSDLTSYLAQIRAGGVEYSDSPFFRSLMEELVQDFRTYARNNGLLSYKRLRGGLAGLSGFFDSLWGGIKSAGSALWSGGSTAVEKAVEYAPAAAQGFVVGGPVGAGIAVAGQAYGDISGDSGSQIYPGTPGYSGLPGGTAQGTYTFPIGGGELVYSTGQAPAATTAPAPATTSAPAQAGVGDLLSNPLVLAGGALLLVLALRR